MITSLSRMLTDTRNAVVYLCSVAFFSCVEIITFLEDNHLSCEFFVSFYLILSFLRTRHKEQMKFSHTDI